MMDNGATLLTAVGILLIVGLIWMALFIRVIDPWLRRLLGRLLGVSIHLGEQNLWQINDEGVDDINWRNLFVRPLQMIAWLAAILIPVVVTIALIGTLFKTS